MSATHRILLVLSIASAAIFAGLFIWAFQTGKAAQDAADFAALETSKVRNEVAEANARTESLRDEMEAQQREAESRIVELNTEWTERLEKTRADNDARIGRLFGQFNEIIHDSAATAEYLRKLEGRLRQGKELGEQEIEELQLIAGSLGYLHAQYQKPLAEFRELEQFLINQLQIPPMPPGQRMAFFRRIFSRDYREQELEYQRDLGKMEAFEASRVKVVETYARAQKQMAAIRLDTDRTIARLRALAEKKETDTKDLAEFLRQSHRVLDVHAEVMKLREEQAAPGPGTAP